MQESIERIRVDVEAFKQRVSCFIECISDPNRRKDSCEAAYEGLYKLMQRLKKELSSGDLSTEDKARCHRIAEDKFLSGLLELRKVATHVVSDTARKNECLQIYLPSGPLVSLPFETSAGALFSESTFSLSNSSIGITEINHRDNLSTAITRIERLLRETR